MPRQTPQAVVFSGWLEHKVFALAEHIVEMLAVERTGEYEGLPQDLVASIHNEVLWQVVMRSNFPVNSLAPTQDIEEELIRYLECSKDKAYIFFALCKQLAAWRPDDSIEPIVPPESDVDEPCRQPHAKVDETVTEETKH